MIDKAPCGLCIGLLSPKACLLVDIRQPPEGPKQRRREEKTVKSMAVSQKALVSSSQSSKVALLAALFAPISTRKALDSLPANWFPLIYKQKMKEFRFRLLFI